MTLDEKLAFFFAPPLPMQGGSPLSTLHLVRREAQDCLIGTVVAEASVSAAHERRRLFATTMVLMAAIDLLAKFYAGRDDDGSSGARTKAFLERFVVAGPRANEFAEALYYGCRNPLMHSFSLHSTRRSVTLVGGTGWPATEAVWSAIRDPTELMVSVEGLFAAFVRAVGEFEQAIRADAQLQKHFELMFDRYGTIEVGHTP